MPALRPRGPGSARAPLVVITGASGSGKTTLYPPLLRALSGVAAVLDVDVLHIAHGVARNGLRGSTTRRRWRSGWAPWPPW